MKRICFALLAALAGGGCASNKGGGWYAGAHKDEAKGDFVSIAACSKLAPVRTDGIRLVESVVPVKYPGSFLAPDGTRVHGYCQWNGSHGYKIVSIDDARVRHHERGHVAMWENGINEGHPAQFKRCFFLWRMSTWSNPLSEPDPEVEIVDRFFGPDGVAVEVHQ
jgi:hypothetical protein